MRRRRAWRWASAAVGVAVAAAILAALWPGAYGVTPENYRRLYRGMPGADVREMLGSSACQHTWGGHVKGPDVYVLNPPADFDAAGWGPRVEFSMCGFDGDEVDVGVLFGPDDRVVDLQSTTKAAPAAPWYVRLLGHVGRWGGL